MKAFGSALVVITAVLWIHVSSAHAQYAEDGSYSPALSYAKEQGWMTGSASPAKAVTKAELLKIVLLASGHEDEVRRCRPRNSQRIADVPPDAWFAPYVCAALRLQLVVQPESGHFNPGKKVSFAETAKIVSLGIDAMEPVESPTWYAPYVSHLATKQAVPPTIVSHKSYVARGELAEMLQRLKQRKTDLAFADAETLLNGKCTWFEEQGIPGVDLDRVKETWLSWINDVRASVGVRQLSYDRQLTRTAAAWSGQAALAGAISHKREGQTAYYDYNRMTDWFDGFGIRFANVDRTTFTESIGWGIVRCPNNKDCTEQFISAVKTTFDFYMAEKGKASKPHYNSMVNSEFRKVGLGIAVKNDRYYLTMHYGTAITSSPEPLCP